jgi:hypothetical protein
MVACVREYITHLKALHQRSKGVLENGQGVMDKRRPELDLEYFVLRRIFLLIVCWRVNLSQAYAVSELSAAGLLQCLFTVPTF